MSDMSEFVTQNDTEYYCVNFEAVIGTYTNGKGRLRRVGCQQFPSPGLTP